MSYFDFLDRINRTDIRSIFELGSRDLIDTGKLARYYDTATVYAFECNPDCLIECNRQLINMESSVKYRVKLIDNAISLTDGYVKFYPFDLAKYDNMGASSMLKIDFSKRHPNDPDYNRENPQKEILVKGTRLDTFMIQNNVKNIDLLCIDLQGYELNALKSLGENLRKVKYIITECSIHSTYEGGASFRELTEYLEAYGFVYKTSNIFGDRYPDMNIVGFSEFDALFVNE